MMVRMSRKGDAGKFWWSVFGFVLIAVVGILKWKAGIGDTAFVAGLILGAGMIRPDFVIDVVKAWRKTKEEDPPDGK